MRPMGYWIKEIDRRIEAEFERLLTDEQLTRRHWQVLTTLARGPASRADLDAALAPFVPSVRSEIDGLISRGWATESRQAAAPVDTVATGENAAPVGPAARPTGLISLTTAGRAAHDRAAERVRAFRTHVTDGLSEQDYRTLVTLLERVAGNLTPA